MENAILCGLCPQFSFMILIGNIKLTSGLRNGNSLLMLI